MGVGASEGVGDGDGVGDGVKVGTAVLVMEGSTVGPGLVMANGSELDPTGDGVSEHPPSSTRQTQSSARQRPEVALAMPPSPLVVASSLT